jgi:membrane protein
MNALKKAWAFLYEKYELLTAKKYTTVAGTLVFFLIMSLVPMTFWVMLLFGKLPFDTDKILNLPIFASVKDVLAYVRDEAINATSGASVFLLVTSLYSATSLFYQMRRSGEIVYGYRKKRHGLKLRVGAVALLFSAMALVLASLLLFAIGTFFFSWFVGGVWETVADYLLLAGVAYLLVFLLNVYMCPYKTSVKHFGLGSLCTVLAWAVALVGFTVYLSISNMTRLYGALSTLIVFLLWLYVLMICFVAGVIFNSETVRLARKRERLYK